MLIKNIPVFFPQAMKSLPNWILWKLETDANGRKTKVPYSSLYDGKASVTNPGSWTTFEKVYKKLHSGGYDGLGFVFTLDIGIVFIDIDHCIDDNGNMNSTAIDIINTIGKDTYFELSQSGTGIHGFAYGSIPKAIKRDNVEMYSEKRFVAMTGRAISACDPSIKASELLAVYNKYKKPEIEKRPRIKPDIKLSLTDNEIIDKASHSRDGELFRKLMSGDYSDYSSQSDGDFKLCQILAFWSDRDFDTISRIFYSSGLYRKKWDRKDYRERTINRAIDYTNESYSEFVARKRQEEALLFSNFKSKHGGLAQ